MDTHSVCHPSPALTQLWWDMSLLCLFCFPLSKSLCVFMCSDALHLICSQMKCDRDRQAIKGWGEALLWHARSSRQFSVHSRALFQFQTLSLFFMLYDSLAENVSETGERVLTNLLNICDPHTCYHLLTHMYTNTCTYSTCKHRKKWAMTHITTCRPWVFSWSVAERQSAFVAVLFVLSIQMLKLWSTAVT